MITVLVPETGGCPRNGWFFFDFSNDPETGDFSDYYDRNYAQKNDKANVYDRFF